MHLDVIRPQTVLDDAGDALLQLRELARFGAAGLRQQAAQGISNASSSRRESAVSSSAVRFIGSCYQISALR
jgi:hypothetical protein